MEINREKISPIDPRPINNPLNRLFQWSSHHWIVLFAFFMGIYVGLPFLAPVFMYFDMSKAARAIYFIYGFFCHQLPQRSIFLFGPKVMYSLTEIQASWQDTTNPVVLRQFIGTPELGWKVAWSDRMVSMYASTLIFGLVWAFLHKLDRNWRLHLPLQIPWWVLILLLFPMALDGTTHFLSDLAGIDQGFRYTNAWLATLTNNTLPLSFYVGDAIGSFNSWMRLFSGLSFGFGLVWFGFPYIEKWFAEAAALESSLYQKG